MKTIKIYAVVSSQGSYDDYCECVEKCFTNIADAEKYAREIDESHEYKSRVTDDMYVDIEEHWYDDMHDPQLEKFCRDNGIPTMEEMSDIPGWMCGRTEEQTRMIREFLDKIEEQHDEWCIKYLTEHYPEYTEQDYWDYMDALEHAYDDWHDCEIREFELVVDDNFKIE